MQTDIMYIDIEEGYVTDYNLPDGCTTEDIDRAMYYDDASCFTCGLWYAIDCAHCDYGICENRLAFVDIDKEGVSGAAKDIAENCVTYTNDYCSMWRCYE